jgi:hypothetical protein
MSEFERLAAETKGGGSDGLPRELWDFVKHNKKWWLLPILLVVLLARIFGLALPGRGKEEGPSARPDATAGGFPRRFVGLIRKGVARAPRRDRIGLPCRNDFPRPGRAAAGRRGDPRIPLP